MSFEKIDIKTYCFKPFSLLAEDWALLAAGDLKNHNAMTISWGGFGILWRRPVATVFVRPQRFTKTFIDSGSGFTLNFFDKDFKQILQFFGTNSGRDVDKDAETKLVAADFEGAIGYEQARLVLVCKKLFVSEMESSNFLDSELINSFYPESDFHTVYVAEIESAFLNS